MRTEGRAKRLPRAVRERQIMDLLYERGECSAREVHEHLPDAPSYSAVRAMLAILLDKGELEFRQEGARYLYSPARPLAEVQRGAAQRLIVDSCRPASASNGASITNSTAPVPWVLTGSCSA